MQNARLWWQLLLVTAGLVLVATIFIQEPSADNYSASVEVVEPSQLPTGATISETETALSNGPFCTENVAAPGGLFIEGVVGRPTAINPLFSDNNPIDANLANLIFDGLTRYDSAGQLVPALAENWEVSDDRNSITFQLRSDAIWHDGQPVTSADVAFTYGLIKDGFAPDLAQEAALWASTRITVVDDRQIQFTLPNPYAPFLEATTRGILPAHLLAEVAPQELTAHPFNSHPIGTGPFQVVNRWTEDGYIWLRPSTAAFEGAYLDGLLWRFYATEEDIIDALQRDEIAAAGPLSAEILPSALATTDLELFTAGSNRFVQLLFNQNSPSQLLQDRQLREALTYLVDRQELVDSALHGQGIIFEGPYLPISMAYDPFLPAPLATNIVSGTQLLDEAGWIQPPDGPPSNLRTNEETPLILEVLAPEQPHYQAVATKLSQQFQTVGIGTELTFVPAEMWVETLTARRFDLAIIEILPSQDPDLYDFWSQEAIVRGQNYGYWNNRRASEALEAARQVWEPEERKAYYRAFLDFYSTDIPAITLYQAVTTTAVKVGQLQNVEFGIGYEQRQRFASFSEWYLYEEEQLVPCS